MREQLKLLEDLQKVDLQLQEAERGLGELPKKLQSMRDDVATVERMLEAERARLEEVQSYKSTLEGEIKHDQELLGKTKSKLAGVRTSKEYMAIQREFETNKRLVGERDAEVTKLNAAIEETKSSIAKHEEELKELQQHVDAEAKEMQDQLNELESGVGAQRSDREALAEKVEKRLLRRYDQIRKLRGGLALVVADAGVCSGCRMQLPPQLYNVLHQGTTIEQCPTCQRIVVFHPAEEAEA